MKTNVNGILFEKVTPTLMYNFKVDFLRCALLSRDTCLRLLALGGERCPSTGVIQSWRDASNNTQFYNLYGITEVSSWATYYHITQQDLLWVYFYVIRNYVVFIYIYNITIT